MSGRLTREQARRLVADKLGETLRAAHSTFVAELMAQLARQFGADAELWWLVGLCHDLDILEIGGDWSKHGIAAADMLAGRLPEDALDAIRAHDHRTGMESHTQMADMLKLADAIAALDQQVGRASMAELGDLSATALVGHHLSEKSWLGIAIDDLAARNGLPLSEICVLLERMPEQSAKASP
jgi:hypothetical protein